MAERLTERDELGNADIIGVYTPELMGNLEFKDFNQVLNALNKLAHYEDLEEQLENLYGGKMPLDKVVENLNRIVQNGEEKLDYARILTNAEAEKWDRWLDLAEQGRLIALPCKVGDAVYEILPPCDDTLLCETFQKFFISRCVNKECGHYIQIKQFRIELLEKFGNTVFLTKEEAEAKLKERGAE